MVWFLIEAKSIEFCSSVKEGVLPFNRLLWVVKLWFQVYIHKLTICFWHDGFKETVSRSLEYLPVYLCMVGMFKIHMKDRNQYERLIKGLYQSLVGGCMAGGWGWLQAELWGPRAPAWRLASSTPGTSQPHPPHTWSPGLFANFGNPLHTTTPFSPQNSPCSQRTFINNLDFKLDH